MLSSSGMETVYVACGFDLVEMKPMSKIPAKVLLKYGTELNLGNEFERLNASLEIVKSCLIRESDFSVIEEMAVSDLAEFLEDWDKVSRGSSERG